MTNEAPPLMNWEGLMTGWDGLMRLEMYRDHFNAQGFFRFFRNNDDYDEITAINGKLYINNREQIEIEGLEQFQTERPVEAVQYKDKLYIATGTKLVVYDGEVAKIIEPYTPQPLEMLYIGGNALADNPDAHLTDGEADFLRIDAVIPDRQHGVVNENIRLHVYVSKPSGMSVEYKVDHRKRDTDEWNASRTGFTTNPSRTLRVLGAGEWELMIYARPQGDDNEAEWAQFYIPKYEIKATDENEPIEPSTLHQCNRILLHWDRLLVYGDPSKSSAIYMSHVKRPTYFPVPNSLEFESPRKDEVTSALRFRDHLVVFTKTSAQALFGRSPSDYRRVMLNTTIGCIAPYSARVVGNAVVFLAEEGVHMLRTLEYSDERANIEKIDMNVHNLIHRDTNACAITFDNQYHLVFPDQKERFRWYYKYGTWTKDTSRALDFIQLDTLDGVLYGMRKNGDILVNNPNIYMDDSDVYELNITTKNYNFNEPYHPKKPKELHLMLNAQNFDTKVAASVFLDQERIVGGETSYPTIQDDEVTWTTNYDENVHLRGGTVFGGWVLGKSPFGENGTDVYKVRLRKRGRGIKMILKHKDNTALKLLGLGLIFKVKRP